MCASMTSEIQKLPGSGLTGETAEKWVWAWVRSMYIHSTIPLKYSRTNQGSGLGSIFVQHLYSSLSWKTKKGKGKSHAKVATLATGKLTLTKALQKQKQNMRGQFSISEQTAQQLSAATVLTVWSKVLSQIQKIPRLVRNELLPLIPQLVVSCVNLATIRIVRQDWVRHLLTKGYKCKCPYHINCDFVDICFLPPVLVSTLVGSHMTAGILLGAGSHHMGFSDPLLLENVRERWGIGLHS